MKLTQLVDEFSVTEPKAVENALVASVCQPIVNFSLLKNYTGRVRVLMKFNVIWKLPAGGGYTICQQIRPSWPLIGRGMPDLSSSITKRILKVLNVLYKIRIFYRSAVKDGHHGLWFVAYYSMHFLASPLPPPNVFWRNLAGNKY